jgi:ubiquinone/menaquinone biosynthesis C-methylase UbiE
MIRVASLSIALLLLSLPGWSQVAEEANRDYQTREGRARIAERLDDSHRRERLDPARLVAALEIKPGMTVADVGTGTGVMLPYLSKAAGPSGRIFAQDIHRDFLDKAEARAKSEKLHNVTFRLGTDRDPGLPEGQVDLVLVLDAYHHFDYPAEMLRNIGRALRPQGRVAIVDFYRFRRGPDGDDMRNHVRADKDEVLRELKSYGYELASERDHGGNQYILILDKKP